MNTLNKQQVAKTLEDAIKAQIGAEYLTGTFASEDGDKVKNHYRLIAEVNHELFKKIPFDVVFDELDHYQNAKDMRAQVVRNGVIYIFSGGTSSAVLSHRENLEARAVHDVFAHMQCGCPFSFAGELNAMHHQAQYYPKEVYRTLFAEIPAQTAAFYASGKNYPKQRAIEAPEAWIELAAPLLREYNVPNKITIF